MTEKESTYFVLWGVFNEYPMKVGNRTVISDLTGKRLVNYIIKAVTSDHPGAVVLNIVNV